MVADRRVGESGDLVARDMSKVAAYQVIVTHNVYANDGTAPDVTARCHCLWPIDPLGIASTGMHSLRIASPRVRSAGIYISEGRFAENCIVGGPQASAKQKPANQPSAKQKPANQPSAAIALVSTALQRRQLLDVAVMLFGPRAVRDGHEQDRCA